MAREKPQKKFILLLAISVVSLVLASAALLSQPRGADADILYGLADFYAMRGRPVQAAAMLERAMAVEERPGARLSLAVAYIQAGNLTKSEALLKPLFDRSPGDMNLTYMMATLHYRQGNYALAESEVRKVIAEIPGADNAYDLLGSIYLDQGRLTSAEEIFKKGIEINPLNPTLHNGLGVVYAKTGRTQLAIGEYRRALELDPTYTQAHVNLEGAQAGMPGA